MTELQAEGGIQARNERYSRCNSMMREGMEAMGFKAHIDTTHQGPIITTFFYPENAQFTFASMYDYSSVMATSSIRANSPNVTLSA